MIERDGWVFSSQPVWVREEPGRIVVERRRQAVSPAGALEEEIAPVCARAAERGRAGGRGEAAGLEPVARHVIPETPDHIGSVVVECRR